MKRYEGSIAEIGTEEWTEPHFVDASNPISAAEAILESHLKDDQIEEDTEYGVCLRQMGVGASDWAYFKGKAEMTFSATISRP